ncbi:hypothetical protein G6514_004229 [Epicoccum nigrum]|nr:hypothetical protein G6514_004229 [Epicoccum nigrum]
MATPNLTLHHLQIGQGERIPWLLEELNLPYKLATYKRSPLLSPPELKALHPLGASPVLEDHTDALRPVKLAESGAITEYLIHKYGNGKLALAPEDKSFADYLYWFHFANATLQPALFRRAMLRGAIPNAESDMRYLGACDRVNRALAHLNDRLLKNDWLAGEEFTAADVMTGWCVTTMRMFAPIDLSAYEGILGWVKRFNGREAYQRAMAKCDPELDLEETASARGPKVIELFVKAMAGKM